MNIPGPLATTAHLPGQPVEGLDSLVGQSIGAYRITAFIGAGGQARVYRAVVDLLGYRSRGAVPPAEVEDLLRNSLRAQIDLNWMLKDLLDWDRLFPPPRKPSPRASAR